jgi:uncharacterized protein with HEPN domain
MRDPRERLRDIIDAINDIERHNPEDQDRFLEDELIQNWFVQHLQIIGEAARALPSAILELAPDVPWRKIFGMRNILVHEYFGIDFFLIWGIVENDLPKLKGEVERILNLLESK